MNRRSAHGVDRLYPLGGAKSPYTRTMAISGRSRVRTELFELTVIPTLTPHPVQMHRQLSSHRYFRDLPAAPHGEVKELAAPLRLTAHRDLGRFHQQEAQQWVALSADMSESAASPLDSSDGTSPT
jgi:hypothetical protein